MNISRMGNSHHEMLFVALGPFLNFFDAFDRSFRNQPQAEESRQRLVLPTLEQTRSLFQNALKHSGEYPSYLLEL